VRLIVADKNLVTSIAGGNSVRKFDSFHDAELVQNRSGLLTEDDYSLHLALHDNDVAEPIDGHATWILQDVRTKLADESTVPCKYLHLQKHSKPEYRTQPSLKITPTTLETLGRLLLNYYFSLWPPRTADVDSIFLSCFLFLSFFFFSSLISAVADWMSTILLHMVWP